MYDLKLAHYLATYAALPLYNSSIVELNVAERDCDSFTEARCIEKKLPLVPCSEVYNEYWDKLKNCPTATCRTITPILLMAPHSLCLDPNRPEPTRLNNRGKKMRITLAKCGPGISAMRGSHNEL